MASEITLTSDGSQKFSTVIDKVKYSFKVSYNSRIGIWTATISKDGVDIVNGLTLVGGVDLLNQYTFDLKYLFAVNIDNPNFDASDSNLGVIVKLYKLTEEEVSSLG